MKNKITLKNPNPTKTEEQLYFQRGYYVLENSFCEVNGATTPYPYIVYAVCPNSIQYHENIFPQQLTIDPTSIDRNTTIKFRCLSEEVEVNCWMDMELLALVKKRMDEILQENEERLKKGFK